MGKILKTSLDFYCVRRRRTLPNFVGVLGTLAKALRVFWAFYRAGSYDVTFSLRKVFCLVRHKILASLRLRLHERGFISIRFPGFETASKAMRFGSVYTEPFSYSLRHAEVIVDQRDLGTKRESTILFFSAWLKVHLCPPGLTTRSNSF